MKEELLIVSSSGGANVPRGGGTENKEISNFNFCLQ